MSLTRAEIELRSALARLSPQDTSFFADGLCYGTDSSDLFFSVDPDDVAEAKKVCSHCDVADECLAYGLAVHNKNNVWGVWGGRDAEEIRYFYRHKRWQDDPR